MANKTNTVAKGDAFENRVYSKLKSMLDLGEFSLNPSKSHIYQKKKYTDINGSEIVFDIAIETYRENAKNPSYITLIECKDYKSSIDGEKIRSFATRIKDVGGHKGYFVTTSSFQKAAFNKAKAEKIGLVIMDTSNEMDFKLERIGKQSYQIKNDIENVFLGTNNNQKYPFIAIDNFQYYTSIYNWLSDIAGEGLRLPFKIPFISDDEIEKKIVSVFHFKNREDFTYCITTEELVNTIEQQYNVKFTFEQNLYDELGYCNFKDNSIAISSELEFDTPRWRFTLAHEIGHYLLHKDLYNKYNISIINDDSHTLSDLSNALTKRLEIQANKFASLLLLPREAFAIKYTCLHYELFQGRKFPFLHVDKQQCNQRDYNYIVGSISNSFCVSKEVIKNRLLKMEVLTWNL